MPWRPVDLSPWLRAFLTLALGALLGVFFLHPLTMGIYWLEFEGDLASNGAALRHFIVERMAASFTREMLPMTALFATIGAFLGVVHAAFDARMRRSRILISQLEREMSRDVPTLIHLGENEHVEFKSTLRWDLRAGRINRDLADVVAKTIAGLANHEGGSLLIGVDDEGGIVGLHPDYQTLRKKDRDGFAQFLMTLVRERLGGHVCRLVHPLFVEVEGRDLCRVIVEAAGSPVFFDDGVRTRFFVRAGNATRELDARETLEYVAARWGGARCRHLPLDPSG